MNQNKDNVEDQAQMCWQCQGKNFVYETKDVVCAYCGSIQENPKSALGTFQQKMGLNIKLENYTPHPIRLFNDNENGFILIPSSGNIRMKEAPRKKSEEWHGIPVYPAPQYIGYEGVPVEFIFEKGEEIGLLVSMPVGKFFADNDILPSRIRILGPDTSPENCVRNEKGEILGSKALILYK